MKKTGPDVEVAEKPTATHNSTVTIRGLVADRGAIVVIMGDTREIVINRLSFIERSLDNASDFVPYQMTYSSISNDVFLNIAHPVLLEKSKGSEYFGEMNDPYQIEIAVEFLTKFFPAKDVEEALKDLVAKRAARETTGRAETAEELLPSEILSPEQVQARLGLARDEASPWRRAKAQGEQLPLYIARVFAAEIETGTLAKADFYQDEKLYKDYYEWRRKWQNRKVPDELRWLYNLPTKHTRSAQQPVEPVRIENFTPEEQEVIRRYEAAKRRVQRRRRLPQEAAP